MLEQPTELDRLNRTLSKLEILREALLDPDLFNSSLLEDYAKEVADAVQNGIDPWNNESRWSAMKSVFFASTVLTTIGKSLWSGWKIHGEGGVNTEAFRVMEMKLSPILHLIVPRNPTRACPFTLSG